MTPTEIKAELAKLGGGANKRLGQHFLIDTGVLEKIVDAASIKEGDHVLEIGPGLGVLTKELVGRGARVTAIEQDFRFLPILMERIVSMNLEVVHGDAAANDWDELIGDTPWKFVSNLPYSITSLAIRKALWGTKPPGILVVLIQREVAERAIARDGKTSLLSLMVALASSSSRIVTRVARGAFFPAPKVESAVLEVIPMDWKDREKRWGIEPQKIMDVAKKGFAHPRKFLASNLGIDASVLSELGLNPKARSEELSPDDWAKLARKLA
ncbi:MAG: 16S rRNA (adenine(1518)-N(6)/adenine(1519)-N(6))-dimethyltransferase RsmA [Patescibacteria group bacterium]